MTTGIFEYDPTTGAKKGPLTLLGQMVGYGTDGMGVYVPLDVGFLGADTLPAVNDAPTLSGSMTVRTTSSIAWVAAADDPDTAPVTSWQVQRRSSTDNGGTFGSWSDVTGSPFVPTVLSLIQSGLADGTPAIVWDYRVRGHNAIGAGVWSNEISLQYAGSQNQQPTACTNLTRTTITATSATLHWTETADPTVTKHGVFINDTLVLDNVDAAAVQVVFDGRTPQTPYSGVNVRRWNGVWSPASNSISFTTLAASSPTFTMLMGVSVTPSSDHGGTENWDLWRSYDQTTLTGYANRTGAQRPKAIAFSDDGPNLGGANPDYTTVLSHCISVLDDFYYNGTGQTRSTRWGISVYWSNGSENYTKGALASHTANNIALFVTSQKALYDACHKIDPITGQERYPDAYAGSNPTTNQEQKGTVADALHPAARYHDFVLWSMYPPGISDGAGATKDGSDPTFNFPSYKETDRTNANLGFLIRCFYRTFQAQAQARIDTGNPNFALMIGCGETSIGIDPDDNTTRPYWTVFATAGAMYKLAQQYGLVMPIACWWEDKVPLVTPDRPSLFRLDPTGTSPSTREAWQNWQTFHPDFGGAKPAAWAGDPKTGWKTSGPVV